MELQFMSILLMIYETCDKFGIIMSEDVTDECQQIVFLNSN
jgi:hypothetical protein